MRRAITTILYISLHFYSTLFAQNADAIKEYNAGLTYYNLHNYTGSIPFFEAAIKKDASFINAYRVLISCHEQEKNIPATIPLYEKVVELSPSDKSLCYNLAMTFIDLKDYQKASLYLKKALTIDPTYAKAAASLKEIDAYFEKERIKNTPHTDDHDGGDSKSIENSIYNAALNYYREEEYSNCLAKLKEYSDEVVNPNFYYLKAIALQHLGDRENAIYAYEQTLELDDRHFDANLNLGTVYYNDKNFQEAMHLFETAYMQRKKDQKIMYALAKSHYYIKEYSEAIPYFEEYVAKNNKGGEAWRLLGECYSKIGKSKNAAAAFEEAKKYGGGDDEFSNQLDNEIAKYGKEASEHTKNGNYDQAIAILEKGIKEHSETASLHFNLGLNYMEIGNVTKAREEFKKTIDLEPAHAKAYQGLGQIYYERGEFSEAAAYYMATLDAGKHDEFVYYKLGSCHFKLKRYDDAIAAYKESVKLNATEKRYFFGLGLAYLAKDESQKSIEAMEAALKLDYMFLDAQYHICVNYVKTSRYEECIAEAEKILKKNDQFAKAYLVIGHAHKRMGNYVLADEFQKKAERLDPTLKQ